MSKKVFPSWVDWIDSSVSSTGFSPAQLADYLPVETMEESHETEALKHSLQTYETDVILLEESENLYLAWQSGDSWNFFRCASAEQARQVAGLFEYLTRLRRIASQLKQAAADPYLSLDPLVYRGDYWLDKICPEEYTRHEDAEATFSLLVTGDISNRKVEEVVRDMPDFARSGYMNQCLLTVLPFTSRAGARRTKQRLKDKREALEVGCLESGRDFNNVRELIGRVRKLCE